MEDVRPPSATDPDSIARIRSASFPIVRRGYDKREVERFLDLLAGWLETGGADEVREELIRRDLARAGAAADAILRTAEEKAAQLIAKTEERVNAILAEVESATVTPIAARPSPSPSGELDLNAAGARQLAALGLSSTQARRVIAYRDRLGGFASVDDLDRVPGIPATMLADLKPRLFLAAAGPRLAEAA
jgi:competence protein ComEA